MTTTHRQRLMYGVNLNVLAERRAALRFECNRDLKLSEVRCLEYRRSFTTRRAIFTSSSRSRRQFLTQHPPHGHRLLPVSIAPLCACVMKSRTLLPAALASVSFGFVLVRVRVLLMHVEHILLLLLKIYPTGFMGVKMNIRLSANTFKLTPYMSLCL